MYAAISALRQQQAGERSPGVLTVLIWQTNPHPGLSTIITLQ